MYSKIRKHNFLYELKIMKTKNCCILPKKEILRDKIQREGQNMEDQIFI